MLWPGFPDAAAMSPTAPLNIWQLTGSTSSLKALCMLESLELLHCSCTQQAQQQPAIREAPEEGG